MYAVSVSVHFFKWQNSLLMLRYIDIVGAKHNQVQLKLQHQLLAPTTPSRHIAQENIYPVV